MEVIPIDTGEGRIIWNSLQECDPCWCGADEAYIELPDNYRVDVGWYGSLYRVLLVHDTDWESPIPSFETTDPHEAARVASDYCMGFREILKTGIDRNPV